MTQAEKETREVKDQSISNTIKIPNTTEIPTPTEQPTTKNKKLKSSDRTLRTSTLDKVLEAQVSRKKLFDKKLKKKAARLKKSSTIEYIPLTQEQLLKEAEETEILNKKSLEVLTAIEEEKKKVVFHKATIQGPYISFLSTTSERFQKNFGFLPIQKPVDSSFISLSIPNPNIVNSVTFSNGVGTTLPPPSNGATSSTTDGARDYSSFVAFPSFFSAPIPQRISYSVSLICSC